MNDILNNTKTRKIFNFSLKQVHFLSKNGLVFGLNFLTINETKLSCPLLIGTCQKKERI